MKNEITVTIETKYTGSGAAKQAEGDLNRVVNVIRRANDVTDAGLKKQAAELQRLSNFLGRAPSNNAVNDFIRKNRIEVTSLSRSLKQGSENQTDYNRRLSMLPPIIQQAITQSNRFGKSIQEAGLEAKKSGQFFQQVFSGSFLGTLAAGGIVGLAAASVTGLVSMGGAIKDLGVKSVRMAADFEPSVNAMKVFTGSLTAAKAELHTMGDLSRSTAGLRLDAAEQGAVRLRALNFEARTAQDYVVGLAKHKMLSGADEGAVQRVIVNLTQLSSGSTRVSQDMKEMIMSMPTLRGAIISTFGSLEKFKAELQRDPDATLKKFASGLRNTETASAGLNDAFGKMEDAFTLLGRAFGEPILDPFTENVKDLTKYISENEAAIASWGQSTGDWLRGATNWWKEFNAAREERKQSQPLKWLNENLDPSFLFGGGQEERLKTLAQMQGKTYEEFIADTPSESFAQRGARLRKKAEAERFEMFGRQNPKTLGDLASRGNTVDFGGPLNDAERNAREANEARKAADVKERARLKDLETSKMFHDRDLALLNDAFSVQAAKRDLQIRYTLQQELSYQSREASARRNHIRNEIAIQTAYFDKQVQLADGNAADIEQINVERVKTLSSLSRQFYENEYKSQKQLADLERQIANERRQAQIELKALQATGVEAGRSRSLFDLERSLARDVEGSKGQFDRLIAITQESYKEISRITAESYALQLQDKSLSAEQRANIEKKASLEQEKLAEENRQTILGIEDRKHQAMLQRLDRFTEQAKSRYSSVSSIYGGLVSLFNPEQLSRGGAQNSINTVFGAYRQAELDFQERAALANKAVEQGLMGAALALDKVNEAWQAVRAQEGQFSRIQLQILGFLEDLQAGRGDKATIFDQIIEKSYYAQRALERAGLEADIDNLKAKMDLADVGPEKSALGTQIHNATLNLKAFDYQTELGNQSLETRANLTRQLNALLSGDAVVSGAVRYQAENHLINERIGLLKDNLLLEERIRNVGVDAAQRYRRAWLEATLEIRDARIRANEDIIRSQVLLDDATNVHGEQVKAGFLRHLEEQKTATQATTDLLIGLYDKAGEGLDKLLDRGGIGKIPVVGDYFKALARGQLTQTARQLADFLPDDLKGLVDAPKTGNALLDENIKQTRALESIDKKLAGGSGPAGSLGGKAGKIIKTILGGGKGQGPGGTPYFNGLGEDGSNPWKEAFDGWAGGGSGSSSAGVPGGKGMNMGELEEFAGGEGGPLGSLKGLFSPRKNLLTGNDSQLAGYVGGIGSLMGLAGGLIGGRAGGVLSMAGMGANIGSMFGGVGAIAGAGIGAVIGLLNRDDATKKLKEAALSEFSLNIKEKSVLNSLKAIGESAFGKGQVGAHAVQTVNLDSSRDLLRVYAESTGQSSVKIDRLNYGDANWSGNQFRSQFSGFNVAGARAVGGPVRAGFEYLVGERGPEIARFPLNGEIIPNHEIGQTGGNSGVAQILKDLKQMIGEQIAVNDGLRNEISRLRGIDPQQVVAMGAPGAAEAITDAVETEFDNNGQRAGNFRRLMGEAT